MKTTVTVERWADWCAWCGQRVAIRFNGHYYVHCPRSDRCEGSGEAGPHAAEYARPAPSPVACD
jgi:hypothetical protein